MTQGRIASCRICNRTLTNPRSIAASMGPVCIKRFGVIFDQAVSYAESIGRQLDVGLIENLAVITAQEAYRERLSLSRSITTGNAENQTQTVMIESRTRGQLEPVEVEFYNGTHGRVTSQSGDVYEVTENSCTCPHFRYRLQNTGEACRHIEAYRSARSSRGVENVEAVVTERQNNRIRTLIDERTREQVRTSFQTIDWREEEAREGVLNTWRQNRAFDGIYMSENDEAWQQLRSEAELPWNYKYENVLGGTGNSFGVEIEFELERGASQNDIVTVLRSEGITEGGLFSYHGGQGRVGPGMWRLERDGSLNNGMELVSPILFDRREDWEKLERATKILKENGAKISTRCGGHIHVGIAPMDHRTYSYQRLARIGLTYEKLFYRMGSADNDRYERLGNGGYHRGTEYVAPLSASSRRIYASVTAEQARGLISPNRYSMMNLTNVDATYGQKPTIEMRYPNSSLSCDQWQAQIQVANAVVHQAAVINNESPQSAFTPRLSETNNQLRYSTAATEGTQETYLRRFLDVLGHKEDRLAATWLFLRGNA